MSEAATEQGPSTSAASDKYGLMSSIAAVREIILKHQAMTGTDAMEELNKQKQNSYQEKLHLQEEIQKQRALLKDLGSKAEHAQEEAQREKSLRLALEETQSKLEDHRRELLKQLETTRSSQAVMEEKIVRFHEDLDKQNVEFDKERAKWDALVKGMKEQDANSRKEIGQFEARLLSSQQEAKDAKAEIVILKKQVESADARLNETVQGYKNVIEQLNKRIEGGQIDTIEDLQKRLSEAESNYETTLEKLRNAREELLSYRQFPGKRQEELFDQQAKVQARKELQSTEALLEEAEKELESTRQEVATLENDESEKTGAALSKHTSDLAKARLEEKKTTLKVRQLVKKLEGLYKRRLEVSKSEVTGNEQDLETITERLQMAKEEATKAQADMESFQSKKATLIGDKDDASKKRAAEPTEEDDSEAGGEKRQKQS